MKRQEDHDAPCAAAAEAAATVVQTNSRSAAVDAPASTTHEPACRETWANHCSPNKGNWGDVSYKTTNSKLQKAQTAVG